MMKKNARKLGAPSFRVAKATRKALAAVLAACMLLTLLPMAALAVDEPTHSHKVCVNTVSHGEGTCAHTDVTYTAWTETDRLPESGNYYLAVDVTLGATSGAALGGDTKKAHITGELNLCLNGHSINYTTDDWNDSSYPDNANGPINVDENGTLNLCDCQNTTYRFQETYSSGDWYWTPAADGEDAKYTVNSGYITGKPYGGLVHVNGGTFHFWSGALINNKNGSEARGINLEKGTANLYGGQISGHNDAGVSVGERYLSGARTLNCYGTCISDNYIRGVEAWGTAESHATIHMTAPTKIERNGLGGVRLYEYADFTMVGGEITGSEGENGALYCNGDNTVTLSGGKITGNIHAFDSSWGHGSSSGTGGIGIEGDDVLTISGDVLLSGNTDTGDGSKPCDLHIYNQDPTDYHPIQIAGALTKPAQPATIYAYKPNNLKTTAFTSGWATHMASANIADYFVSYDPAYTIGKNTDGELIFAPAHSHTLQTGDQWTYDSSGHWRQCTDPSCPDVNGSKADSANHVWRWSSTSPMPSDYQHDATHHWVACTVCGYQNYKSQHRDDGGGWHTSAAKHWKYCMSCGGTVFNEGDHQYGDDGSSQSCTVCGYKPVAHTHGDVTFTAWTSATSLPDAEGNYYLTADVTLADTWNTPEDVAVNLCLNGHRITSTADPAIESYSALTLSNCDSVGTVTGPSAVEIWRETLSFALSGNGQINLVSTGRYGCALNVRVQNLRELTTITTIPAGVTISAETSLGTAVEVNESNNKVVVDGGTINGGSATGLEVNYGEAEVKAGSISGAPALYNHWNGKVTVSGGTLRAASESHAIEVMGPVSVTGAPTIFGPAAIIYANFSSGVQHGLLDTRGYTGSQKISLMIQDTAPAKAAVGDTIVTNGTLSQFQWVNSKFSLAADGADLKLAEKGTTPATYTVTFNANGHGTAPASITNVTAGSKITAPTPPTAQGWTFGGWYQEAACTTPWVFETNTVTDNVTLYAKWTEVPSNPAYDISGTVTDESTSGNATVTLMRGNTVLRTQEITLAATGAAYYHGNYSFTGVEPGVYNVVARSGDRTKTILVVLTNANAERQDIRIVSTKQNSVVEVKGVGTPAVVVGGVDRVAELERPGVGETVTVKLTVEKKAENAADNATEIKAVAGDQTLDFLELKLEKTVTDGTTPETTTDITDTGSTVIEIVVPFPFANRQNVTVYRYHGDSAAALTKNDTKGGGTFRLDTTGGLIYIYATKFSTYAIGYTAETTTPVTPSRPGSSGSSYRWPFTDVKRTDPCYQAVKYAYDNKLMEGTSATTFDPEGELTRAMLATVLYRAAGSPKVTGAPGFEDVEAGVWYSDAVVWASQTDILRGYGNGKFGPDDPVSKEMLNLVIARQKGEDPVWVGDSALAVPATRAEVAEMLMEYKSKE